MKKVKLYIGLIFVLVFSGCTEEQVSLQAVDDSKQVVTNGSVTIDVLINDISDEGTTKSIASVTNGTHGDTEIIGNQIRYTAKDSYVGRDTFTYVLLVNGSTDEGTVMINIIDIEEQGNKAPYANAGLDKTMELSQSITIIGQDSDRDGRIVDRKWSNSSGILARARTFSYTPTSVGTKTLTYTVKDNDGASDSDAMKVFVVEPIAENHTPVAIAANEALESCEIGTTLSIQLQGSDADGDSLVYSIDVSGLSYGTAVLTDEDVGSVTFTLNHATDSANCAAEQANSFTFKVNDETVDSSSATVQVITPDANHAPIAVSEAISIASCDIGTVIPIQLHATDVDGDTLVYSIDISMLNYGAVVLTDANTGTATYTIDSSEASNACLDGQPNSFTFVVNDTTVDSNTATIDLTPH